MKIIEYDSNFDKEIYDFVMDIKANELGWKLDAVDLHDIEQNYLSGNGNFWLAVDDEKIIGTLALKDMGNGLGYLKRMYLAPDYRGSGLATEMLNILFTYARENDIKKIYLATTPNDASQRAIRFYEKSGFKQVPSLPANFADDGATYFCKIELKDQEKI